MTTHTKATTCLDCTVLPPFSVVLCPLHAAAEEMLVILRELVVHRNGEWLYRSGRLADNLDAIVTLLAKIDGKED